MTLVRGRRMLKARRLLTDPNQRHSVQLVASDVGYNSANNFARAYRQHFGHSPRDAAAARQALARKTATDGPDSGISHWLHGLVI